MRSLVGRSRAHPAGTSARRSDRRCRGRSVRSRAAQTLDATSARPSGSGSSGRRTRRSRRGRVHAGPARRRRAALRPRPCAGGRRPRRPSRSPCGAGRSSRSRPRRRAGSGARRRATGLPEHVHAEQPGDAAIHRVDRDGGGAQPVPLGEPGQLALVSKPRSRTPFAFDSPASTRCACVATSVTSSAVRLASGSSGWESSGGTPSCWGSVSVSAGQTGPAQHDEQTGARARGGRTPRPRRGGRRPGAWRPPWPLRRREVFRRGGRRSSRRRRACTGCRGRDVARSQLEVEPGRARMPRPSSKRSGS